MLFNRHMFSVSDKFFEMLEQHYLNDHDMLCFLLGDGL